MKTVQSGFFLFSDLWGWHKVVPCAVMWFHWVELTCDRCWVNWGDRKWCESELVGGDVEGVTWYVVMRCGETSCRVMWC